MKLYTSVDIAASEKKIRYSDKILLLGSCFADNIGAKFEEHYFQTTINPYGTLYNPASIALSITDSRCPTADTRIIHHNGLWHSMMHHGTFSGVDKKEVMARCEQSREQLQGALNEASTIVVTFGTAWVYEMNGEVVANCHKIPANCFVRRCMTVQEIVDMWQSIVDSMPTKHWIFTVSPIRHIKDGLHANQVSKAILLQAVDQLGKSYFPSYEIMMDELRDYRFYAEDMLHPSPLAVKYIWECFCSTYMSKDTQRVMKEWADIQKGLAHRPFNPDSDAYRRFLSQIVLKIEELKEKFPYFEVQKELEQCRTLLNT